MGRLNLAIVRVRAFTVLFGRSFVSVSALSDPQTELIFHKGLYKLLLRSKQLVPEQMCVMFKN